MENKCEKRLFGDPEYARGDVQATRPLLQYTENAEKAFRSGEKAFRISEKACKITGCDVKYFVLYSYGKQDGQKRQALFKEIRFLPKGENDA